MENPAKVEMPAKAQPAHQDAQTSESLEVLMQKFAQSDESHPGDQALT